MAVPKKRTSSSKSKMRRSHQALGKVNVIVDSLTGEYKLPHHISLNDGYYDGRQVFTVVERVELTEFLSQNSEDNSDTKDNSEK